MKYTKSNELELSVFQLGTVQLGMDYGLGDNTKKPKMARFYYSKAKTSEIGFVLTFPPWGKTKK